MPSGSTYIVDINKIRKPGNVGTGGIFIGNGSSNRESLYAVRGTGSGHIVIYDKVKYYLNVDNITNQDPASHDVTFTYTSKRTHGNLTDEDTLSIYPKTYTVQANTSTATTRTTTVTVRQTVSATDDTPTGNTVDVTITQKPDYATGITLTIEPKSAIPASGGTISSALTNFTYTVKADHKSGNNNVNVTSLATVTADVTGITASSKGTSASTATTVGYINFTATYSGLTSNTVKVAIWQDENKVVNSDYSKSDYTATVSIGAGLTAGASSAAVSHRGYHLAYDLYSSGSYNNQHQVDDGSNIEIVTGSSSSRFSLSNNTLSHTTMGTNLGTDSVTVKATNKNKSTATATTSTSVTNTRSHSADTPSNYVVAISIGNGLTAAGGSAAVTASASHTNTFTWAYTSGSKETGQTETITDTADVTLDSATPTSRFSYASGTITHTTMGTSVTTDSVTMRVRNHSNTATTNTATKSIVNEVTGTSTAWNNPSVSISPTSASVGSGATSASFTGSATQSGVITYTYTSTSTSTASTSNSNFSWGWSSNQSWATVNSTSSTASVSVGANGGDARSATITLSVTGQSKTNSTTASISQAAAQSLLTPIIRSFNISFSSDPEPTPTNPTVRLYCTNSLPIDVTLGLATGVSFSASELIASGNVSESSALEHACTAEIQSNTRLYLWIKTPTLYQIGGSMVSHSKFYTWNNSNGGSTPGTNMNSRWLDSGWLLLDASAGYVTNFNTEVYDVTITLLGL